MENFHHETKSYKSKIQVQVDFIKNEYEMATYSPQNSQCSDDGVDLEF